MNSDFELALRGNQEMLAKYRKNLERLRLGLEVENLTLENCERVIASIEACIENIRKAIIPKETKK